MFEKESDKNTIEKILNINIEKINRCSIRYMGQNGTNIDINDKNVIIQLLTEISPFNVIEYDEAIRKKVEEYSSNNQRADYGKYYVHFFEDEVRFTRLAVLESVYQKHSRYITQTSQYKNNLCTLKNQYFCHKKNS